MGYALIIIDLMAVWKEEVDQGMCYMLVNVSWGESWPCL